MDGQGAAPDRIVVVDPADGTVDRSFEAPNENSEGITFLNGSLFVSVREDTCCGPPSRLIVELDPSDGTELNELNVDSLPGDTHAGLANDGNNLVISPQFDTILVFVDPNSGSQVSTKFLFDPGQGQQGQFSEQGFAALAISTSTPQFYAARGDRVLRFGEEGDLVAEFDMVAVADFGGIQGAVFVGNLLYLAESQEDTIQAALVPTVTPVRTTDPRAMATDGSSLFLVVNGEPFDQLMKLDPNTPNDPW